MKRLYTIYEDDNRIVVGILINNSIYYFQKGFESNEAAHAALIEMQTQKELEKHPNLSPGLAREFATCELNSVIWGNW